MKLFIYLGKGYLRQLLLLSLVLLVLITLLDFIEVLKANQDKSFSHYFYLTLAKSANTLVQISPLLVLISTVINLEMLSKGGELMGLASLGVSKNNIISKKIFILIVFFVFILILLEKINPYLNSESDKISSTTTPNLLLSNKSFFFKRENKDGIYFILADKISDNKLENIKVWLLNNKFNLIKTFTGTTALFTSEGLELKDALVWKKNSFAGKEDLIIKGDIKQEDFFKALERAEALPLSSLPNLIVSRINQGFSVIFYEKYFYSRLTLFIPFITMLLIGFQGAYHLNNREKTSSFYSLLLGIIVFLSEDLIIFLYMNLGLKTALAILLARISALSIILVKNGISTRY